MGAESSLWPSQSHGEDGCGAQGRHQRADLRGFALQERMSCSVWWHDGQNFLFPWLGFNIGT